MRYIISGGGTAGHINPAIAIANYIKSQDSSADILFVGTPNGMECKLVTRAGYPIECVDVKGLKRSLSFKNLIIAIKAVKAVFTSKKIIKRFKPDAVIGTGGYVCAPVLYAAASYHIPTLIHEQNVFPGLTVRLLADKADITAISFDETASMIKNAKRIELVGNPIREEILNTKGKKHEKPVVMISGGSLGANSINNALIELLKLDGQDGYEIIASVGERNYKDVMKKIEEENIVLPPDKKILPYIYSMDEVLADADIAVTRAGAITISELCAIGKPAIIIPSPNVVNDHQTYNAEFMAKKGAAFVIREENLTGKVLAKNINEMLSDRVLLDSMRKAAKSIAVTTACQNIYDMLRKLISE